MKRLTLIDSLVVLLCLTLVGCVDDSYTGTIYVEDYTVKGILHEVRMTIGETKEAEEKQSKGSGVIGSVSGLADKDFYVYAFNRDKLTDYSVLNAQDSIRCLVDGSYDDPTTLMGRRARWNDITGTVEWGVGDKPIYYPMGENEGHDYDFFAYFLDNIVPANDQIHRTEKNVVIDVEIDGCQDLMSTKAKPTDWQLSLIEDERERLYQEAHCYGYYTASHNLNPNFDFIHHLVKLDFKLIPGGTPGMTKDVMVERIEIRSKYKAEFTVADKYDESNLGLKFSDDTTRLQLREPDGSDFIPRLLTTYSGQNTVTEGVVDDLGSLLVAPDEEYVIYIVLSETAQNGVELESKENELLIYQGKFENKIPFTAGNEYLITMTIYGQMDIKVSADIGDWNAGGDADYDNDESSRPNHQ